MNRLAELTVRLDPRRVKLAAAAAVGLVVLPYPVFAIASGGDGHTIRIAALGALLGLAPTGVYIWLVDRPAAVLVCGALIVLVTVPAWIALHLAMDPLEGLWAGVAFLVTLPAAMVSAVLPPE